MRTSFCGLVVLGVALAAGRMLIAGDGDSPALKKDRKMYEGTWRVVALVIDGKVFEDTNKKFAVINHLDGSWSLHENDVEVSKGMSQIDPAKNPKTIDFTPATGAGEGKSFLGIYELGEKTRKLCFAEAATGRPTEFSSEPCSKRILVTLERVKAK